MPARSKSQQRLFGMVHAYQKGKLKDAPEEVKRIARGISDEDAEHFAKTKHKGLPEKKAYTQSPPTLAGEKNTLLSETARAAWADLTRTRPRDRTAADLSPGQRVAFARAWSVDGDGIHRYSAYKTPVSGTNSDAFSPRYWTDKDPNHQVEKLFGRGTASWSKDGDLVFNDTYDLDFGGKNLPGVPTSADPDDVKIRSRISARALGLDPKQLWETANSRIQKRWAALEPVMDKVYKDVQAGSYKGQADLAIQEAKGLQARYNRINSGPYRPEAASTLATWKDPYLRNIEEFGKNTDQMPEARIRTERSPAPVTPPSSQAPQTQPSPHVSAGYGKYSGIPDRKEKKAADRLYTYLPKDNTALTDGLLSTALSDRGFEKYRGRTGKYKKEDVLKVLDSWEPEWTRSKAISALAMPISEDAAPDLREFADTKELYSFDLKDLIKAGILVHLRHTKKKRGTYPVEGIDENDKYNWKRKPFPLRFKGIPHYMVEAKDGKIPPELIRHEKQAEEKDIGFPKDEIEGLTGRDSIVTHRVSDDAGKYEAGDIVKSPWGDKYEVSDRKDISKIEDSPYYKYLTDSQKALLKVYDRIAVLRLKRHEKKASAKIDIPSVYEEVRKAYTDMGYPVSGDRLVLSEQPTYIDGRPVPKDVINPRSSGGNTQDDGTVRINPRYRAVMRHWKLKGPGRDFLHTIIGHELGHHIDRSVLSKPERAEERKRLIREIAKAKFHTVYTDSYGPDTDPRKLDKELLAEYLADMVRRKLEKKAQAFSQDGKTVTLSKGQTPSHVVRAYNKAHPDSKITVPQFLKANGNLAATKFRAGKAYSMPVSSQAAAAPAKPVANTAPATSAAAVPAPSEGPIGYRNNNAGNLKSDGETLWQGADGVPEAGQFIKFKTPFHGIRAMARTLFNYGRRHKIDSLEGTIRRYAPASENNQAAYLASVRQRTGFKPGAKINLTDEATLQKLVPAMGSHEIGPRYFSTYDPSMVSNAVARAVR